MTSQSFDRRSNDFEDNDDLAVFEQVQEILGHNSETFDHFSWVSPDGDIRVALDFCGTLTFVCDKDGWRDLAIL
jgi:hypothetical protein